MAQSAAVILRGDAPPVMPGKKVKPDLTEFKNNREEAVGKAIDTAVAALRSVDLSLRCRALALPVPQAGTIHLRMFARDVILEADSLVLCDALSGEPAKPADRLLLLHYLQCDLPIRETGALVTFRDFPGGQFYYHPFLSRSVNILLQRFGNNVDALAGNFARFDTVSVDKGDAAARIAVFGPLSATLVYHRGDDEFPPAAVFLFDESVKKALGAEDAAVIASRICLGLL